VSWTLKPATELVKREKRVGTTLSTEDKENRNEREGSRCQSRAHPSQFSSVVLIGDGETTASESRSRKNRNKRLEESVDNTRSLQQQTYDSTEGRERQHGTSIHHHRKNTI
jgi:hypothetical protein